MANLSMKFDDMATDVVYFTEWLMGRYPTIFSEAATFLAKHKIEVRLIEDTHNIWCRDYMPLQVGDHFVKFKYADSNFKNRRTPPRSCYKEFDPIQSKIILDGGNLIRRGEDVIITKMVLKDNPNLKISELEELLEAEVTLIPIEPYDTLGHADGICKFTPYGSLVINDYYSQHQKYWREYQYRLIRSLEGFGLRYLPFAYDKRPKITEKEFRHQFPFADDFNPGWGYYMNFLLTKNVILLPKFGIDMDEAALEVVQTHYPIHVIKQIDCSQLSMEGGLLNCISWNIIGV